MSLQKLIKNPVATSSTGGWCANASYEDSGKHITDKKVIPALAKLFTGKYVASFGDGPGRYKQLLLETTLLKGYDAYDGAPYTEKTSDGRVKFLDLTIPQYGLPLYDWVVSLEVAEHIPQQFESVYIDNIIRHARDGIVISWAIPGQEGYSHVNNRKHEYVQEIIESKGFTYIPNESQTLKNSSWLGSFKNHLSVYRRRDLNKIIEEQLNQNA